VGASEEAGIVKCSLKLPLVQILVAVARIQRKGVFEVSVGSTRVDSSFQCTLKAGVGKDFVSTVLVHEQVE